MLGNVGVDFLIGSVPLFGDLFDAAWKATGGEEKTRVAGRPS